MMPLGAYRSVLWVVIYLRALERDRSSLRGREGYRSTMVIFVLIEDSDCMEEMVGKRFGKLVIIDVAAELICQKIDGLICHGQPN